MKKLVIRLAMASCFILSSHLAAAHDEYFSSGLIELNDANHSKIAVFLDAESNSAKTQYTLRGQIAMAAGVEKILLVSGYLPQGSDGHTPDAPDVFCKDPAAETVVVNMRPQAPILIQDGFLDNSEAGIRSYKLCVFTTDKDNHKTMSEVGGQLLVHGNAAFDSWNSQK